MAKNVGTVIQVMGPVLDIRFADDQLPKLLNAIEQSKENDAYRLFTGFGIPNVGKAAAKSLLSHFKSIDAVIEADIDELKQVSDIGDISAASIFDYLHNAKNTDIINRLKELCLP